MGLIKVTIGCCIKFIVLSVSPIKMYFLTKFLFISALLHYYIWSVYLVKKISRFPGTVYLFDKILRWNVFRWPVGFGLPSSFSQFVSFSFPGSNWINFLSFRVKRKIILISSRELSYFKTQLGSTAIFGWIHVQELFSFWSFLVLKGARQLPTIRNCTPGNYFLFVNKVEVQHDEVWSKEYTNSTEKTQKINWFRRLGHLQ